MKIFKKILNILKNILAGVLIVIAASLLIIRMMGDTPRIFGYTLYYIVSPSMEPTLEVGDIILSKEVKDPSTLEIGDVVTYQGKEGSFAGKLVTHQIVEINENEDGTLVFRTKGTKEGAVIDPAITADQIDSIMIFEVPLLGKIMQVLNTQAGFFFLLVIPLTVCLVIEIMNFVKILKNDDVGGDEDEKNER